MPAGGYPRASRRRPTVLISLALIIRQLCHLVQFNIEEALASPNLPLRVRRERQTDAPLAERFDLDEDDGQDDGEDGEKAAAAWHTMMLLAGPRPATTGS